MKTIVLTHILTTIKSVVNSKLYFSPKTFHSFPSNSLIEECASMNRPTGIIVHPENDIDIPRVQDLKFKVFVKDRAHQHCRSKMVRAYLKERNNMLMVVYFPKGSPEFNAVEECWRQGKHDLLVSKYYTRFTDLKKAIAEYYRTKRFNLDIVKYLSMSL